LRVETVAPWRERERARRASARAASDDATLVMH